ncbi:MAG: hypothetical protein JST22_01780 [Bacteroidetes bacterium]|nr:hypothetical protein [Bacteroidota bacterium]
MKRTTRIALLALPAILLAACFHKSDETGTADDVKQTMICHTAKGDFLITHEEVFHATSKSSGGRGTFVSGYADYRFTVRNLATGQQVARLVTGERDEDLILLGFDGTRLWCYSADKSVGLHARDPATLGVVVTRDQVEKGTPALAGRLASPSVSEAGRLYGFDPFTRSVILADMQGNLYSMDAETLRATAIAKMPKLLEQPSHASTTGAYRWRDESVGLRDEPRGHIEISNDVRSTDSYLHGEIMLEGNVTRLAEAGVRMRKAADAVIERMRSTHDSLLALYPVLRNETEAYRSIRDADLLNGYYRIDRKLQEAVEDSASNSDDALRHLPNTVLGCDSNVVYIAHANNLADTSSLMISRVSLHGTQMVTDWTTLVPQIYANPSKGIKVDPLAETFKSGDPDFDYEWYGVEGNVLVGVKMLFAFALDIRTGKLLWKQQL